MGAGVNDTRIAIKYNLRLNEYGLFNKNGVQIAGEDEEGIYKRLGLDYVEPELRID